MDKEDKKRFYVGGLYDGVTQAELRDRFGRFGKIIDIDIKVRKDDLENTIKTFAYVEMSLNDKNYRMCMKAYNKTRWKGSEMQIQIAKESYLSRLQRERDQEKYDIQQNIDSLNTNNENLINDAHMHSIAHTQIKGATPGTLVEGEKNWVVGKYGRVLPIVHIRRKDKQKIVTVDPSKFCHGVKKLTGEADETSLTGLTWQLPEIVNKQQPCKKRYTSHSTTDDESSDKDEESIRKKKKTKKKQKVKECTVKIKNVVDPVKDAKSIITQNGSHLDTINQAMVVVSHVSNNHHGNANSFEIVQSTTIPKQSADTADSDSAGSADTDELIACSKPIQNIVTSTPLVNSVTEELNVTDTTLKSKNPKISPTRNSNNSVTEVKSRTELKLDKSLTVSTQEKFDKSLTTSTQETQSAANISTNAVSSSVIGMCSDNSDDTDSDSDSASELYRQSMVLLKMAQDKLKKKKLEKKQKKLMGQKKNVDCEANANNAVNNDSPNLLNKVDNNPQKQLSNESSVSSSLDSTCSMKESPTAKTPSTESSDYETPVDIKQKNDVVKPNDICVTDPSCKTKGSSTDSSDTSDSDSESADGISQKKGVLKPKASSIDVSSLDSLCKTKERSTSKTSSADSSDSETPDNILQKKGVFQHEVSSKTKQSTTPSSTDSSDSDTSEDILGKNDTPNIESCKTKESSTVNTGSTDSSDSSDSDTPNNTLQKTGVSKHQISSIKESSTVTPNSPDSSDSETPGDILEKKGVFVPKSSIDLYNVDSSDSEASGVILKNKRLTMKTSSTEGSTPLLHSNVISGANSVNTSSMDRSDSSDSDVDIDVSVPKIYHAQQNNILTSSSDAKKTREYHSSTSESDNEDISEIVSKSKICVKVGLSGKVNSQINDHMLQGIKKSNYEFESGVVDENENSSTYVDTYVDHMYNRESDSDDLFDMVASGKKSLLENMIDGIENRSKIEDNDIKQSIVENTVTKDDTSKADSCLINQANKEEISCESDTLHTKEITKDETCTTKVENADETAIPKKKTKADKKKKSPVDKDVESDDDTDIPKKKTKSEKIKKCLVGEDAENGDDLDLPKKKTKAEKRKKSLVDEDAENGDDTDIPKKKTKAEKKKKIPVDKDAESDDDTDIPKKKNKAEKKINTNEMKKNKHELSNQKRLDSLKEKKQESQSQQKLIKNALSNIDNKTTSNKIVFDSDEEEIDSDSASSEAANSENTSLASSKVVPSEGPDSQKLKLFEGEVSSSDDEEEAGDMFRIRREKEGKGGAKLSKLQNRYGNDQRFKLTEHFLDSDGAESSDGTQEESKNIELPSNEVSERDRALSILQSVVGGNNVFTQQKIPNPGFQDSSNLRYDPSKDEHQQYELAAKQKTKKSKTDAKEVIPEPESLPEVSKNTFFDVKSDLKAAFSSEPLSGGTFSFTDMFGGSTEIDSKLSSSPSSLIPSTTSITIPPVLPLEDHFAYDSSDNEHPQDNQKSVVQPIESSSESKSSDINHISTFFFTPNDPRIKTGIEGFCRKDDSEVIRSIWEENMPQLRDSYRMLRKRALRNAHASAKYNSHKTKPVRNR